jgi:hypothetical protein
MRAIAPEVFAMLNGDHETPESSASIVIELFYGREDGTFYDDV